MTENALRLISKKIHSSLPHKVRSVSWSAIWRCALVSAAWAFTPYLVFLGASVYMYVTPFFRPMAFIFSFGVFLALGKIFSEVGNINTVLVIAVLLGIALYLLLGVKDLLFINRAPAIFLFELILIGGIFFAFFWFAQPALFGIAAANVYVFIALLALLGEYFAFLLPEKKRGIARGAAAIMAFILFQILWAVSLLPLDFIHAALLMTIITFSMSDIAVSSLKKRLSARRLAIDVSAATLLVAILFLFSRWTL